MENQEIYDSLSKGKRIVWDFHAETLKKASFYDLAKRFAVPRYRKEQDEKIFHILESQIQKDPLNESLQKACQRFSKTHKITLKKPQMKHFLLAKKCEHFLKIPHKNLITDEGIPSSPFLRLTNKHHLHYIIPKVDPEGVTTAILYDPIEKRIWIRAKDGHQLLKELHWVKIILNQTPIDHMDYPILSEIKDYLETLSDPLQDDNRVFDSLCSKLSLNYHYIACEELLEEDTSQTPISYLTSGLEAHDNSFWNEWKPSTIEYNSSGNYEFRLITHLPAYAGEKNIIKFAWKFFTNLLSLTTNGHSYFELTEPISSDSKENISRANVYSAGYYAEGKKCIKSPDPRKFIPSKEQKIIEIMTISKDQFEKGKCYLEAIEELVHYPPPKIKKWITKNRLAEKIEKLPSLKPQEQQLLLKLYNRSFYLGGDTCLTLARDFRYLVTDIPSDYRTPLQKYLFPEKYSEALDFIDRHLIKVPLLDRLISLHRVLYRADPPYITKSQNHQNSITFYPQSKQKPEKLPSVMIGSLLRISALIMGIIPLYIALKWTRKKSIEIFLDAKND